MGVTIYTKLSKEGRVRRVQEIKEDTRSVGEAKKGGKWTKRIRPKIRMVQEQMAGKQEITKG